MTARLLMTQAEIDADRDAWLARRRDGITGTEVAQLLGISPYGSPFSLYHAKIDGAETEDNDAMTRGRHLEPYLFDRFAGDHPWYHLLGGGLYSNTARPWQLATLDRIAADTQAGDGAPLIPLEGKTWATRDGWGEPGTSEVPVHIRAQALWNLDTYGAEEILIPVLFMGPWRIDTYRLRRDDPDAESDIALMAEEAERFLHRIAERDEPDVDDRPATTDTLRRLHPSLEDRDVTVPRALARRYLRARLAKAAAEARLRQAQNELRARMGSAARAVARDDDGRITKVCSRSIGDPTIREHTRHYDKLNPGKWGTS